MMDLGEFEKRYKTILSEMSAEMNKALGITYKLEITDEELIKLYIGFVVFDQYKSEQIAKTKVPRTFEDLSDLINGLKEKGNE